MRHFSFLSYTGVLVPVISEKFWEKRFYSYQLHKTNKTLVSYDGSLIKSIGNIKVEISFKGSKKQISLHVIKHGVFPYWDKVFQFFLLSVNQIGVGDKMYSSIERLKCELAKTFPIVFSSALGCSSGSAVRLGLRGDAHEVLQTPTTHFCVA